jgi:hypothetical protein
MNDSDHSDYSWYTEYGEHRFAIKSRAAKKVKRRRLNEPFNRRKINERSSKQAEETVADRLTYNVAHIYDGRTEAKDDKSKQLYKPSRSVFPEGPAARLAFANQAQISATARHRARMVASGKVQTVTIHTAEATAGDAHKTVSPKRQNKMVGWLCWWAVVLAFALHRLSISASQPM